MSHVPKFSPLPRGGAVREPVTAYGHAVALIAEQLGDGDGRDACYRAALYMLHPSWPQEPRRDQGIVKALDALPGLVDLNVIPPEVAGQEADRRAEQAAGILAAAQLN